MAKNSNKNDEQKNKNVTENKPEDELSDKDNGALADIGNAKFASPTGQNKDSATVIINDDACVEVIGKQVFGEQEFSIQEAKRLVDVLKVAKYK